MKMIRITKYITLFTIIFSSLFLCGCWDYKELEELCIVTGYAVDKGEKDKFKITVEVVNQSPNTQGSSQNKPEIFEAEGNTMFEAVRRMIETSGRRLYWAHAQVMIISKDIANTDIMPVLDWGYRDAEVREDIWLLISKKDTASEILKAKPKTEDIVSFQINDTLSSQSSVGRFSSIELWRFLDHLDKKGISPNLPLISCSNIDNNKSLKVGGSAIFKKLEVVEYLNEKDTRNMLWLQDKLKGGIYTVSGINNTNVALEILSSKTKIKPVLINDKLKILVNINVKVNIGELSSSKNLLDGKGEKLLKKTAEEQIKKDIENTIWIFQKDIKSDALGFGNVVRVNMYSYWKKNNNNWESIFQTVDTDVSVSVDLKGSSLKSKPVGIED